MRKILVPVDGSVNSLNAARYAADMALAIDADVYLLHVVKVTSMPFAAPPGYVFNDLENAGNVLLEKLFDDVRERTHEQAKVLTLMEVGSVESTLAEVSARIKPFVVVMGAPEGGYSRTLSGSPALDAARRLSYPVLVIPPDAVFRRIRKVVLACDAREKAGVPVTLSFLQELKELFDARFDIIHIGTGSSMEEDEQMIRLNRWKQALEAVSPGLHFFRSESVMEGVERYLQEEDADWLMLFPGKHGLLEFHRSRSKPLISNCRVPVLSLSEPGVYSAQRVEGANDAKSV